jgi:hypothetical protein
MYRSFLFDLYSANAATFLLYFSTKTWRKSKSKKRNYYFDIVTA